MLMSTKLKALGKFVYNCMRILYDKNVLFSNIPVLVCIVHTSDPHIGSEQTRSVHCRSVYLHYLIYIPTTSIHLKEFLHRHLLLVGCCWLPTCIMQLRGSLDFCQVGRFETVMKKTE